MISMKAARSDQNLTLDTMAERMGVCKATVLKWEHLKRTPTPEQHLEYCKICNRSPSEVWYGNGFILDKPST